MFDESSSSSFILSGIAQKRTQRGKLQLNKVNVYKIHQLASELQMAQEMSSDIAD